MSAAGTKSQLVLALNAGSSSLKASVIEGEQTVLSFLAERLSTSDATIFVKQGEEKKTLPKSPADRAWNHGDGLREIVNYLKEKEYLSKVVAVGHRVVHGGSLFSQSAIVTPASLQQMTSVSHLAPLHNPHNIAGIQAMQNILGDNVPNVAVFDTSFHASIPVEAYTYPIPQDFRDKGMRKYGFHGTSVNFVTQKATRILESLKGSRGDGASSCYNLIVCHLGNGASVTAVSAGKSRDTSMGFTPLSGVMMGTRCGDVDPSLVSFACHQLDKDVDQVLSDLNKRSGLKGMMPDGEHDMRELLRRFHQDNDADAELAVRMFVYRLAQHIASSLVALEGPMDAIVFTAGIGEHSSEIRRRTMEKLTHVLPTLILDQERNQHDGVNSNGVISREETWPVALDIATDEEAMIASECIRLVAPNI